MPHTQGPWTVGGTFKNGCIIAAPGKRASQIVAIVESCIGYDPDPTPESQANARLIAAAPDLLAACQAALKVMCVDGENDLEEWNVTLSKIEAAIAKAEAKG
jgi:hypothetical protein